LVELGALVAKGALQDDSTEAQERKSTGAQRGRGAKQLNNKTNHIR